MAKKRKVIKRKIAKKSPRSFNLRKRSKVSLLIYGLIAGIVAIVVFVLLVSAMKDTPIPSSGYVNLEQ